MLEEARGGGIKHTQGGLLVEEKDIDFVRQEGRRENHRIEIMLFSLEGRKLAVIRPQDKVGASELWAGNSHWVSMLRLICSLLFHRVGGGGANAWPGSTEPGVVNEFVIHQHQSIIIIRKPSQRMP